MQTNQVVTAPHRTGYMVVLVSSSFTGRTTVRFKGYDVTREGAEHLRDALWAKITNGVGADYRVLGPRQLGSLLKGISKSRADRRKAGAKKASATRKRNGNKFVCCPSCGAKSKKLYSEMGGLQTRVCQRGHTFEYDKWLDDRAFWAPVLTGRVIPQEDIIRPIEGVKVKVDLG